MAGRPRERIWEKDIVMIEQLFAQGKSQLEVASMLGMTLPWLRKYMNRNQRTIKEPALKKQSDRMSRAEIRTALQLGENQIQSILDMYISTRRLTKTGHGLYNRKESELMILDVLERRENRQDPNWVKWGSPT